MRLFCLTVLFVLTAHGAQTQAAEAVFYLVRHAEKVVEAGNSDPGLTDQGHERARHVAHMLAAKGVTRILSSDFKRTHDTAKPLAELTGLEVEIYDPRDLEGIAGKLKAMAGVIAVIGHSNTTPELAGMLSGTAVEPMAESVYDRFYEVRLGGEGGPGLAVLHSEPRDQ